MPLTVLSIEVANPARPEVTETVEFLVDSGAVYSIVPKSVLQKLGIRPLIKEEFTLAGSKFIRDRGAAVFNFQGRIGGADVIFGEDKDSQLLGAFTLEALGLMLDPLRRELRPLPIVL